PPPHTRSPYTTLFRSVLDRGSGQPPAVYVYQTRDTDNAVLRMDLGGDELSAPVEVLTGIPKAANHNGGRLKLGPDGHLYVTTGEDRKSTRLNSSHVKN